MSLRMRRVLPIALASLILSGLSFTFGYLHAPQSAEAAPAQQGARDLPGCSGGADTVITDTTVPCEKEVVVEAQPLCPVCPGGLNVVYVQVNKAFQADWMKQESLRSFQELERIRNMDVRVGVISYDSNTVRTEMRMTDRISQARSALNKPEYGHDPHGDFQGAAREALQLLRTERMRHEDEPCELVIFFASTKSIFEEDERNMIQAARMITREGITLIAGCPETVADYCQATKQMPQPRQYYSEAPRYQHQRHVRQELDDFQRGIGLREMSLTQVLPPELKLVADSIEPAPDEIDAAEGMSTTLKWSWDDVDAADAVSITYRVRAEPLGVYDIHGGVSVTDLGRQVRDEILDPQTITLTVPCVTPTPVPPTATPVPPTSTPIPTATPTPTSTPTDTPTATATSTPVPEPIYIPLIYNEKCVPESVYTDVVLVLDMSTSMLRDTRSGQKLGDALNAAQQFIDQLSLEGDQFGGRDQVGIVGFNDTAWTAVGLTSDRAAANAALQSLPDGVAQGTRLDLALEMGQAVLDAGPRLEDNRPTVIMLTDGLPNRVPFGPDSPHPECDRQECTVLKFASQAKDAGSRVFTVGLGLPDDVLLDLLRQAASSPGDYYFAPDGEDLAGIYEQIAGRIIECP